MMGRRMAVLALCLICLLSGGALAEIEVVFENMYYGEAAFNMHMRDEENYLIFQGEKYSLNDDRFTYYEEFPVYGGKTRAVYEMSIPKDRFSVEPDGGELLLGTAVIDIPYKATLYVGEGNRRSGEYVLSDAITLTDIYEDKVYMKRSAGGEPTLIDKVYLYSYEVDGEVRRFAATLYIDYEDYRAKYESDAAEAAASANTSAEAPAATAAPTDAPVMEPEREGEDQGVIAAAVAAIAAVAVVAMVLGRRRKPKNQPVRDTKPASVPSVAVQPTESTFSMKAEEILRRISVEGLSMTDSEAVEKIDSMERICGQIFAAVSEQPAKEVQSRRFLNYYLPTTLKMLTFYRTISASGVSAEEVEKVRRSTMQGMDMVLAACQKLLDNLYKGDVMDVSADVKVLEQMLKRDGFIEGDLEIGKIARKD